MIKSSARIAWFWSVVLAVVLSATWLCPIAVADDDTDPPSVAIDQPYNGSSYDDLYEANGRADDDGSGVRYVYVVLEDTDGNYLNWSSGYWDGNYNNTYQQGFTVAQGTTYWSIDLPRLRRGDYLVSAQAVDDAGNYSDWDSRWFHINGDTTPPSVRIDEPSDHGNYRTAPQARGAAGDDDTGVAQVFVVLQQSDENHGFGRYWNWAFHSWDYFYDNSVGRGYEIADGTTSWSLNLPSLPNGLYVLSVQARDNDGNLSDWDSQFFSVDDDTVAPTVRIDEPGYNASYRRAPVARGGASDDYSGVQYVFAVLRRSDDRNRPGDFWNWTTHQWNYFYDDRDYENLMVAQGTTFWTLALPELPPGRYNLSVSALDGSDNYSAWDDVFFTVVGDTSPPTIAVARPLVSGIYGSLDNVTGNASDADSGVNRVLVELRRTNAAGAATNYWNWPTQTWTTTSGPTTWAVASGTRTWTKALPPLDNGPYAVAVVGVDNDGNTGTAQVVSFRILAPRIDRIAPNAGKVGATVTLTGSGFDFTTVVRFNGVNATGFVVNSAGTQISVTVPPNATTGRVTVATLHATTVSDLVFTVAQPPAIYAFKPASGIAQTSVTVTGRNFTGATLVRFNNKATTEVTVLSDTQLVAKVPVGATTGSLTVTTPSGASAAVGKFQVLAPPSITTFSPASGAPGTMVTIVGANFTNLLELKFFDNRQPAIVSINDTQIVAKVPTGAATGPLFVRTALGGMTTRGKFFVLPVPTAKEEDGPFKSSVRLSGATADAERESIDLRFSSALDSASAAAADSYAVSVNGNSQVLESVAWNSANYTVTIGLAAGALHPGDRVDVAWTGIRDTNGQAQDGTSGPLYAR